LLAAAAERPDVDVLGPKLREWPSLRRLLELGVTISGTGRRETGLERGEYDQGQHDEQREVLAVNTAGMLVRRRVLEELGGFDDHLPVFGNDLDFGWRAADAGHTTLVVPGAVVFHAEAAHRGLRSTPLTGRHTHFQERRAALYTLLVNSPGRALPWRVVRLTFGTFVRMLGFLVLRSVGEALDDLAALVWVLSRPGTIRSARRDRRAAGVSAGAGSRRLLAPAWLPYRHGLDVVGDLAAALTNQAADVAERRRADQALRDPSSSAARRLRAERALDDDEELEDAGIVARYLTNPVALVLTLVVVLAVVSTRTAVGAVVGGALAPVPDDVGAWWSLATQSWHPLGFGTDVPAPAYVAVLALLGSVVGTTGAVSVLMLGAVPFALWGAWRFLRVAGRLLSPRGAPRLLLVAAAATYALVPLTSGAWGSGRLGLVVTAALLPWLAHAALGFAEPDTERRWRAGWRTGLLLALCAAFSPVAWWLALALLVVLLLVGVLLARAAVFSRTVIGPPAVALLVPLVLLAPWWVSALGNGAGSALVAETGRQPAGSLDTLDLLAGRIDGAGAPVWSGLVLLVLAVFALGPRASRVPVGLCWLVALVAALTAAVVSRLDVDLVASSGPAGTGVAVLAVQAALVTAVLLGAQGAVRSRTPGEQGARLAALVRGAGLVAAAAAVSVPVSGLVFALEGDGDLSSTPDKIVPAYMVQSSVTGPEHGILVVRGSLSSGLSYTVRRDDGVTLGEDEVLAFSEPDEAADEVVTTLLARPTAGSVEDAAALGLEWILLPAPADATVAASLDATAGLVQASTDPGTRAWRVDRALAADAVDGPGSRLHTLLLLVQGLGLLVVLVLCLPSLRVRSEG
ncbi:glycosyltransferase family 2 protein, partial [Nocardioides sp.]|uniref:glycosyltransferase family 2 protein n=1 Tax=Nocardioides sp. TaxID=35761 RepID=UPI002B26ECF2